MATTNELFKKIPETEYDNALRYYTDKAVNGKTVLETLENSLIILREELAKIPEEKIQYQYGFGKWTVGEVLQHIINYERIMTEKALLIAGAQSTNLRYQHYTQSSTAKGGRSKSKSQLIDEFLSVRASTIESFRKLKPDELVMIGTLDGFKTSARMIGLCISGHQIHHFSVLKDKYY